MTIDRLEKTTMHKMKMSVLILSVAAGAACSQRGSAPAAGHANPVVEKKSPEHVWTQQAQALDKAKGVEAVLLNSARQRDQALARQSR